MGTGKWKCIYDVKKLRIKNGDKLDLLYRGYYMDDRIDIYSYMKSEEIREHMRKNESFCQVDKAKIILRSFRPVEEKIDALARLADENEDEDSKLIYEVRDLLRDALETIYNPGENQLLNIAVGNTYGDIYNSNSFEKSVDVSPGRLYKSFDDFIGCIYADIRLYSYVFLYH